MKSLQTDGQQVIRKAYLSEQAFRSRELKIYQITIIKCYEVVQVICICSLNLLSYTAACRMGSVDWKGEKSVWSEEEGLSGSGWCSWD